MCQPYVEYGSRNRWKKHSSHRFVSIIGTFVQICITYKLWMWRRQRLSSSLYHMFGARTPPADSPVYMKLSTFIPMLKPGSSRTAMAQMGFQMVALLVTIVLALLGGVITGELYTRMICHHGWVIIAGGVSSQIVINWFAETMQLLLRLIYHFDGVVIKGHLWRLD